MANDLLKIINIPSNLGKVLKNAKNLPEVKIVQTQQTTQQAQCGLITFEGLGESLLIPSQNLGFTTATFNAGWISAIEEAAGGSLYANNLPSPITAAGFIDTAFGDIILSTPVSRVSLFYTSDPTVSLEVYDTNGILLSSTSGPGNYLPPPNTIWSQLTISLPANVISAIRVIGGSLGTIIDNIELCITSASPRGVYFTEF